MSNYRCNDSEIQVPYGTSKILDTSITLHKGTFNESNRFPVPRNIDGMQENEQVKLLR